MSYRDDLDALAARHAALEQDATAARREADDAAATLREARDRARLPVLDDVRVAAPCSQSWAAMPGDDRVRACGACKQNVYDLSAMTRDEALALIASREGRLCVRFYRRADGTILTRDCAPGVKRRRRRRVIVAGVLAMLGGSAIATQIIAAREEATCHRGGGEVVGEIKGPPMMGAVSVAPPAPRPGPATPR